MGRFPVDSGAAPVTHYLENTNRCVLHDNTCVLFSEAAFHPRDLVKDKSRLGIRGRARVRPQM